MFLEVLDGPGAGTRLELSGEPLVLGREEGCDLIVRDPRVSRRHAEARLVDEDRVELRDLGSANGTWQGGERVASAVLRPGGDVRLGETRLVARRAASDPLPVATPTPSAFHALLERSSRRAGRATAAAGAAVAVALVAVAVPALRPGGTDRVADVVADAQRSVLRVSATRDGVATATGSAWVLDAQEGLLVTNAHVLNEGEAFTVARAGEVPRTAQVVAAAPCEDLALLRVPGAKGLRALPLGSQRALRAGQPVVALGFPAAALTSTTGVVSAPRTTLEDPAPDLPVLRDVVQTDTAINPGSSGGPLVDLDGRLVGVNAVSRTRGSGGRVVQGMNFALGVDRVRAVVAALRRGERMGWTGLTFGFPTAEQLAADELPSGLWVTGAVPGTAAAGQPALDRALLTAVDGRPVGTSMSTACSALAGAYGKRDARLSVLAPGSGTTRTVRLSLP